MGKFLVADDYAIMIEEIECNGQSFDWGWVKTPGHGEQAAQPGPEKKRRIPFVKERSGPWTVQQPRDLGFSFWSYRSVYIPTIGVFYGLRDPALIQATHDSFALAMETWD